MNQKHERARRLFVALWPSELLRKEIEYEFSHAASDIGGRAIPTGNFHITLVFLGSVPEARIAAIFEAVRSLEFAPFELILSRISRWPLQQLLCLEPSEDSKSLLDLVGRLQSALHERGFAIEPRRFRAHLTLARDVRRDQALKPIKELRWQVDRFELVESQASSRGSVYTVLHDLSG